MSVHRQVIKVDDLVISRAMVVRLLGRGKAPRAPRPLLDEAISEALALASQLIAATAVIGFSHEGLSGTTSLATAGPLALAVGTIGPQLEERVADLADRGQVSRALILDAVGSAAAEAVADRINGLFCALAAATDLVPLRRASPGYEDFALAEQSALFDVLEPTQIGVRLTERWMMVPRKSVSLVVRLVGATAALTADTPERRCSICGLPGCPYRGLRLGGETADDTSVWQALLAGGD